MGVSVCSVDYDGNKLHDLLELSQEEHHLAAMTNQG